MANPKLRILDLFSGIGGFSLGLERTGGFATVAFCEIDEMCHPILKKNWPGVEIHSDVRTLKYDGTVDVITGGFPCQDLSVSGRQKGIQGERSGLYEVMLSIVGRCKPQWVIFENVSRLLTGGNGLWFSRFLNDLARYGYDAQWHNIPASAIGAIHHRDRIWIIAYPNEKLRDDGGKIYNSIAGQIAECRTPETALALLAKIHKVQFEADEPDHRVLDGLSGESHAHGALGNFVHTKIPEIIGNAILASIEAEVVA